MPRLSIGLPNFGSFLPPDQWRRLGDLAVAAEGAGVDRLVVVDHVTMGDDTSGYQWGRFPTTPDAPWLEPLTVIAAMAALTERVRFGTGVLLAGLRGPTVLAKTAATLDVMSGGRLELGVATGWQRSEYDAAGLRWEDRGRILDNALSTCRALWQGEVPGVHCEPRPVQAGGVPFWIAGPLHGRNRRRIVEHGSGWIPIMGATLADVRAGMKLLRADFAAAGRTWGDLDVQGSLPLERDADGRADLDATLAAAPSWVDAGVTAVHLPIKAFCPTVDDVPAFFEAAATRFAQG